VPRLEQRRIFDRRTGNDAVFRYVLFRIAAA
jgi:hypothetical protein